MNPTNYPLFRDIRVRFHETDRLGHVNFMWHQGYFAAALADYMKAAGYDHKRLQSEGLGMVFVDAHASFHSASFFDETLRVFCRCGRIGTSSIRFEFQTTALEDGRLVASGDVTVVMLKAASEEKTPVPDALRAAIQTFEKTGVAP